MASVTGKRSDIKFCQPCQEENTPSKADGYCGACKEFMCQACFQHHLKAKYCRTHVLLGLAEADLANTDLKDEEKCEKHENETVRFYCRRHDIIGCGDCMLFDGHGSCPLEYIKNVSLNFKQKGEFERLTMKLETFKSENNRIVKRMQKSMEDNKEMSEKLVKDVNTYRNSMDTYLDKVQAGTLSFANTVFLENDKSLMQLKSSCQDIDSEIVEHKQRFNSDRYPDHVLFIHSVKYKSKLKMIEDAIKEAKNSSEIDQYEFKPDKQLLKIVTTCKSLGSFEKVSQQKRAITGIPTSTAKLAVKTPNADDAAFRYERTYLNNEEPGPFWIFVKLENTGRTAQYFVSRTETVSMLKAKIHKANNIPVDIAKIRLSLPFLGKALVDEFRIFEYDLQSGSTLNCFWKCVTP